jgi:hypothetical protein
MPPSVFYSILATLHHIIGTITPRNNLALTFAELDNGDTVTKTHIGIIDDPCQFRVSID